MAAISRLLKLKYELTKLTESLVIDIDINIVNINNLTELQHIYSDVDNNVQYLVTETRVKLNEISEQITQQVKNENKLIANSLLNYISKLDLQILETYNNTEHQQRFIDQSITYDPIPKRSKIPNVIKKNVVASLRQHCSWRYPALIVNPVDKGLIDCAVASDPLYVTYQHDSTSLNALISKFPKIYQNRLRIYDIAEYNFTALPQAQFSIIVNWNIVYNFDLNRVNDYLDKMFNLLRPGGVLLTNLYLTVAGNDDDCQFFDQIACNTIVAIGKRAGFNLAVNNIKLTKLTSEAYLPVKYVCWITMYKPGTLTTVKAHQALARIIEK